MTALLASMMSLVAGLVLGAAIQRWGDGTLATEHHTKRADGTRYATLGTRYQRPSVWID